MKSIFKILFIPVLFSLQSCEEVVKVNLEDPKSRIVINAPLEWAKGTDGSYQVIEISKTASYYDVAPPRVSGALVQVINSSGTIFNFTEGNSPGKYICINFQPNLLETYELEVIYNEEIHIATERLQPVVDFDYTEILPLPGGFTGYEIRGFFKDPQDEENLYLLEEENNRATVPRYQTFNDKFFNGNLFYASHYNEDLKPGDFVDFTLYGISLQHHNYIFQLLTTVEGGPFEPIPAINKGNIKNITRPENYALGYFSLSETSSIIHRISNEE